MPYPLSPDADAEAFGSNRPWDHPSSIRAHSASFARPCPPTNLCRMQLLAGALLERPPGPKYTAELGFAELSLAAPLPKARTLEKWRAELPADFELALRVPTSCWHGSAGPLREGDELDAGLSWLSTALGLLRPSLVVLATTSEVTTGARDRDRLRHYVARLPRLDGTRIAWRPSGLWEPESVRRLAASLGVLPGFDPIDDPTPDGDVVYGSLFAEGLRRSFSHAALLDVVDNISVSAARAAYITIDSPQAFREARLLQSLVETGE